MKVNNLSTLTVRGSLMKTKMNGMCAFFCEDNSFLEVH